VGLPDEASTQQHQDRAQALASAGLQILTDVGDCVGRGDGFEADFAFDLLEIDANQIVNLKRGKSRTQLAEGHAELLSVTKAVEVPAGRGSNFLQGDAAQLSEFARGLQ